MKKVIVVLFVCITSYALAQSPFFRGPEMSGVYNVSGINKDWGVKEPEELWDTSYTSDSFSGISIADGKVFIIDHENEKGIVRALNVNNGAELWRYSFENDDRNNYGYHKSTPTYDKGKVYATGRNGTLLCLEADKGTLVWKKNVEDDFSADLPRWEWSVSPVIDGDRLLIFAGGSKNLLILDKDSGRLIMRAGNSDDIGYSTPVVKEIDGEKQYILFTAEKVIGVSPRFGRVLWSFDWPTRFDVNAAMPLVFDDGRIFITSGYNTGCAMIKVKDGKVKKLWQNKNVKAHFSSPLYYKGCIFANSDPDNLVCLDPKDGSVNWSVRGMEKGGLIAVDGTIIALGGRTGELMLYEANCEKGVKLASMKPLGGQSWTAPVLAGKKLFVRNNTKLVCLSLE